MKCVLCGGNGRVLSSKKLCVECAQILGSEATKLFNTKQLTVRAARKLRKLKTQLAEKLRVAREKKEKEGGSKKK